MSLDPMPDAATIRRLQAERVGLRRVPDDDVPRPGPKPRAPRGQPEHDEQVMLFVWASLMERRHPELRWLFAVPNWIGTRTAKHGAYLKAEGRKPGVPDVWLPVPRPGFAGCVIEMKVKPNRPSDEQVQWLAALEEAGYRVHVCYSWEEARDALLAYLATPSPPIPA